MMSILNFKNVCKSYHRQKVLECINLQVKAGEFFGLVGINGAGKTTLIKSLLDFCEIDAGSIELFGKSHLDPESRRRLGFLPEQFMPPPYLTGQHFLMYMANFHGNSYDATSAAAMCHTLDLAVSALKQPVRDYSKGMAQKLGLAANFLSGKPLLIFDEPMGGLDPKARAYLKNYLLTLKTNGTTLFFSTHLLTDVEMLCDRMAILHEGRLRFVGTPAECRTLFGTNDLEQAYLHCISRGNLVSHP